MVLLGGAAASYAEPARVFSMAGFDGDNSAHDWNDNGFFTRMQERTGIAFSFDPYTDYQKWQQAKADFAQTGNWPDVLFKAQLTTEELLHYTNEGQLLDLKPLLAENAPNLSRLLAEHPEYVKSITLPNGKIGALPQITEIPPQNAMWINAQWLKNLRLDMPTDVKSLKTVLRAFQTLDPNGNGKRDEVPLSFLGVWDLKFLSHAFGVTMNDYHLWQDETGVLHYFPAEEGFADFLFYLRELYAEKLLDPNGFYTVEALRVSADEKQDVTYGIFFAPNPLMIYPRAAAEQYVLLAPLSYGGKQVYRDLMQEVTGGAFAISAACPDPAALLRWVDVLYSKEGAIQAMAGNEGSDYTVSEDGLWQWAGPATGLAERLNALYLYDTGNMPWHFPLAFYERFAEAGVRRIHAELQSLQSFLARPVPFVTLTAEERGRIVPLQSQLGAYVDERIAQFVLGQRELTAETLADFQNGLRERGLERFLTDWQAIVDRVVP